ncbi:MAG: flagellar assembly protein FliH [Pseudolabrys sp.]|nr:flagellar assembly protein FliH [Pseudolabrys sp.]
MVAQAKFLFDTDFAPAADKRPAMSLGEHEARCAEREAAAYQRGVAAAEARIEAHAQQLIAAALGAIGAGIEQLGRNLQTLEMRLEHEAIDVAVAVGGKLAPDLIAREPFAEIAALATDCFQHLVSKPHVAIRVNDAVYETAKQQLDEIARSRGFEGRLVVLAEPEIAPGDCRIEWADGGIGRDRQHAATIIGDAVARYVGARHAHPEHDH